MIVVTGMHRSGTSLTAQVLDALGADFGPADRLYEADRWNANGYLERVDVVDLNSRLVTGVTRTRGKFDTVLSQAGYLRMPRDAVLLERGRRLESDVGSLRHTLDGLFVKDPRFCLTLPTWNAVAPPAALVVALRHPAASVASLRTRNRLPSPLGHRFWRWHMERILPWIDDRTLVVRQETLTGPAHDDEVERIRRWLRDVAGLPAEGTPTGVLDRGLVHHGATPEIPAASSELWDRLVAAPAWGPHDSPRDGSA
jgi:hypothetical protein